MKRIVPLLILVVLVVDCSGPNQRIQKKFEPTFESLDKANPVPEWFKDAKFGIYFHWGVYSVPAFANEWYPRNMFQTGSNENKHHVEFYGQPAEWPYDNFITGAKDKQGAFKQFAPKLKSEGGNFDPEEWAQLFADAGAKFAGPVAEHHDGFSMWASKVNPWNAKDQGPGVDLVGLLANAIRKHDMKLILSMHHAFNITGFYDRVPATNDSTLQKLYGQLGKEKNEDVWLTKHKEIIDGYQPDIIWQDFNLHRISQPVLLQFLSYYYNQALGWNKEVVATYKDGLNTRSAVLDYERGGPTDITENYWLTDDAISSSSWCYTEGIGYYSQKQVLHGFLDRVSKNGNLLLNISPKADGTIPQEQKDILLTMGAWLKKYGEAVYSTRAWEKYGEGPTKMGAAHGVFQAPAEGTAQDVRYTRSKDNTILYAILLGWDKDQQSIKLKSFTRDRIDMKNLQSVEWIDGAAGNYKALSFQNSNDGLVISLPEQHSEELAYVLRLKFSGTIPSYDKYADLNTSSNYYLIPGSRHDTLVLTSDLRLTKREKVFANQWKLEPIDNGYYKIHNRSNDQALTVADSIYMTSVPNEHNQVWKIETTFNGLFKLSNRQYKDKVLAIDGTPGQGSSAVADSSQSNAFIGWQLVEVCEQPIKPFKTLALPGTIEAEDFNTGCPDEAYTDHDESNNGGEYRKNEPIDIEICTVGGYNVGWTGRGEWLTYDVIVNQSGSYNVSFYVASPGDNARLHLEVDNQRLTGPMVIPNTGGTQNWTSVMQTVKLGAGQHTLKLVFDTRGINIDKMVFEKVN